MTQAIGFDNEKYLDEQTAAILERVTRFNHKLYLEFGGKIVYDYHAARVLPGTPLCVEHVGPTARGSRRIVGRVERAYVDASSGNLMAFATVFDSREGRVMQARILDGSVRAFSLGHLPRTARGKFVCELSLVVVPRLPGCTLSVFESVAGEYKPNTASRVEQRRLRSSTAPRFANQPPDLWVASRHPVTMASEADAPHGRR